MFKARIPPVILHACLQLHHQIPAHIHGGILSQTPLACQCAADLKPTMRISSADLLRVTLISRPLDSLLSKGHSTSSREAAARTSAAESTRRSDPCNQPANHTHTDAEHAWDLVTARSCVGSKVYVRSIAPGSMTHSAAPTAAPCLRVCGGRG